MSDDEKRVAINSALGRMFSLLVRPTQPGDVEEYERCRSVVLDCTEPVIDYRPNYVRDRRSGAQGD